MLILRRAFKCMWRRSFRTLLVSLILALCIAVFISTIAGVDASEAATAEMLAEYREAAEATLEETEQSMTEIMAIAGKRTLSLESMDEDVAEEISAMDDVAAVVPAIMQGSGEPEMGSSDTGGDKDDPFAYMVYGVPLDPDLDEEYHVLPVNIVDGRSLEEGENTAVLISRELTDYFGAEAGDTIDIEGTSFEVVGVYSSTMMQNQVYMSLDTAQDLLGMEGEMSILTVYADSVSAVDDVAAEIQSAYPDFMVIAIADMQAGFAEKIQQEQESIIGSTSSNLASIQSLGLGITVATGVIGLLLIFGLMFYTVRERTKEIGTLKALGFSNPDIIKQFVYEGLYIGLVGGAIGLAIATVAASLFSSWLLNPSETLDVSVGITLGSMLLGLVLAVVAGALGSLYPAWRASRVSPMEALRRE